jgi:PAS domain S-box-containing protein
MSNQEISMAWDRTKRPLWLRCTVAVLIAILAAAIRWQFLGVLELRAVFLTFYPAVVVASLYGGFAAGLLATLVSAALADYFWIEPVGQFAIGGVADQIGLVVFLASGSLISYVAEAAHRAQARANKAEEQSRLLAERERAEEKLREQRERLKVTLASIGDGVLSTDTEGKITFINPVAAALTGRTIEDAVGRPVQSIFRIINEKTRAPAGDIVERVLKEGNVVALANHTALVTPDGREIPIEDSAAPIKDSKGNVSGVVLVFHDVTEKRRAQEVLRESESKYRELVQNANSAIIRWKRDGAVTFFNEYAQRFFGYREEEVIGRHMSLLLPETESNGKDLSTLVRDIASRPELYVQNINENIRRDGSRAWMAWTNRPIFDETGEVAEILAIGTDITERKRMEARQEADLAALIRMHELSGKLLGAGGFQPLLQEIMDAAVAIVRADMGTLQLLEGDSLRIVVAHGHKQPFLEFFESAETRASVCGEATKCGERVVISDVETSSLFAGTASLAVLREAGVRSVQSTPMMSRNGTLLGILTTQWKVPYTPDEHDLWRIDLLARQAADLIEHAKAEEVLRLSEEKFSGAFWGNIVALSISRLSDGAPVEVNGKWLELFGLTREEAIGRIVFEASWQNPMEWAQIVRELEQNGFFQDREIQFRRQDGEDWTGLTSGRLTTLNGEPVLIASVVDITDRKQAEETVRELTQRLSYHVDNSPLAVIEWGPDMRLIRWSGEAERMFGWRAGEVIGKRMEDFRWIYEDDEAQVAEVSNELQSGVNSQRFSANRNYRRDGSVIHCEWYNSSLLDDSGKLRSILSLVLDVTERNRMEDDLRKSRDELDLRVRERTAELEKINQVLSIEVEERKKAQGAVQAERQRLYAVLETIPAMVCLLTSDYHVAFANRSFREQFGESHGRHCYEYCFERDEPCDFCESYKVLETGRPHHWELTSPDGGIIDAHDFPFTDVDGSPMILEMDFNITEFRRTEAELKATMSKLEESNQSLRDFASIASHDLQEPLRKVISFGNMLKQKYNDLLGQTGNDYLGRMLDATQRMQSLLMGLLEYSRVTTKADPFTEVDLTRIVRDVLSDLEVRIEKTGAEVRVLELPVVKGDATQMRQVFQNLIGNALKFHKEGEKPVIEVRSAVAGGKLQIVVEDNGIGFEDRYIDRIFAPFQRLHGRSSQYEGTGMGLAICKKIVERHEGSITADSTPGAGAKFIIRLPIDAVLRP